MVYRWGFKDIKKSWGAIGRGVEPLFKVITSPKYAGGLGYGGSIEGAYLDADLATGGLEVLEYSQFERDKVDSLKGFLGSTRDMRN
jgi:hypothetical protein